MNRFAMSPLKQALRLALSAGLRMSAVSAQAGYVEVSVKKPLLQAGDVLEVIVGANWEYTPSIQADAYLSLQTPDSYVLYFQDLRTLNPSAVPIVKGWWVSSLARVPVFQIPLAATLPGRQV
jgi:hypothetical protein